MNRAKRTFDLALSLGGLAMTWPAIAVAAVAIRLEDGGPVLFRQERVGREGKRFRILKLRTMEVDADRRGALVTTAGDRRVTRCGQWLRRLKLDELPQLVNVLRGEMSFVGPRPEVPRYVELYTAEEREVLRVVPGITDPSSIKYRNESDLLAQADDPERYYRETVLPDKIRLSLDYARSATLWSDVGILLATVKRVVEVGGEAEAEEPQRQGQ